VMVAGPKTDRKSRIRFQECRRKPRFIYKKSPSSIGQR
jgi:hypothetical protein